MKEITLRYLEPVRIGGGQITVTESGGLFMAFSKKNLKVREAKAATEASVNQDGEIVPGQKATKGCLEANVGVWNKTDKKRDPIWVDLPDGRKARVLIEIAIYEGGDESFEAML